MPATNTAGGSASTSDGSLTFHALYSSPLLTVSGYCCQACRGGPAAEEQSSDNNIVLMRHGAFSKHLGRRTVTADVNQVVFFSKESTYRVSHPTDCGDRGTVFTLSQSVLNDMIRELDPYIDDHPGQPFPFVTAPCSPRIFGLHREIAQKLDSVSEDCLNPLWADVTLLQLIAEVLEAAFASHDQHSMRCSRAGTGTSGHADRIETAKVYLATRLGERVTLDDVASAVHTSPFHFARTFRKHTGIPVHRYLTHLRLRNSLERLADGADDITVLALDLGFSSHSHFSETFRREFGLTPSEIRRKASCRLLEELSKNLKA
jgi:AraC family transcriptional regulator